MENEPLLVSTYALRPVQWASALVRRTSEFLEGHPNLVLACLLAGYLTISVPTAVLRPYWVDELAEAYVAAQSSTAAVWHSLQTAPPTTDPPLHYLLNHWCLQLFGMHAWASRLPAIAGFFVGILCVYQFVRRRLGVAVAAVSVTLLLASHAMYYASEGRPYGVVVGCCGITLLAWQSVILGIRPRISRILIALGIAGAIVSHYYGILFGLPVFVGEAVRFWRKRQVDWGTLAAIGSGYLAMLVWIPFLPAAMAWKTHIWFIPAFENIVQMLFDLGDLPLIILFLTCVFFVRSFAPMTGERKQGRPIHFRQDEAAAIITLVMMPFIGFFVSKFASKLFLARYVIASSLGVSILIASMTSLVKRPRRAWISVVAIFLFCFVMGMNGRSLRSQIAESHDYTADLRRLAALPGPIVITGSYDFVPSFFYASPELKSKLYWLNDRYASLKYLNSDTDSRMLSSLQLVRDIHVVDRKAFLQEHRSFYLYQRKGGSYDIKMMLDAGMQLTYLGTKAGGDFYHVTEPASLTSEVLR